MKKKESRDVMHFMYVDDAIEYGVNPALILANFRYWLNEKKTQKASHKDGRVWYYNSRAGLTELHPYFSERQVRTAIDKLIESGIIITGNYNKRANDKTIWYSIDEPQYLIDTEVTQVDTEVSPTSVSSDTEVTRTDLNVSRTDLKVQPLPIDTHIDTSIDTTRTEKSEKVLEPIDIFRDSPEEIDRKFEPYPPTDKTRFFLYAWHQIYGHKPKENERKHRDVKKALKDYKASEIIYSLKNRKNDPWLEEQGIMGTWNKFWEHGDKIEEYMSRDYTKKKTNKTEPQGEKPFYGYNMPRDMY